MPIERVSSHTEYKQKYIVSFGEFIWTHFFN